MESLEKSKLIPKGSDWAEPEEKPYSVRKDKERNVQQPLRLPRRGRPQHQTELSGERVRIIRSIGFNEDCAPRFTYSEWKILEVLHRGSESEVSLEEVVQHLVGPWKRYIPENDHDMVFALVASIRAKIGDTPWQPKWLLTIRGDRGRASALKLIPRRRS